MVIRICGSCREEASNPKRCSGCRNIWYCSTRCQTENWRYHPADTVYHIALACYEDLIPVDAQTRIDYGFDKASRVLGPEGETMMCGLWKGIFVFFDIDTKEVRTWRKEGKLVEGIRERFETILEHNRGAYCPWFLQRQWLLDGIPADESKSHQNAVSSADQDSPQDIRRKHATLPLDRATCHALYFCLDLWLKFGFVAATCQGEELEFGRKYMQLIRLCTFDEFCLAFETSSIPALFERCGLSMSHSHMFLDVMASSPRSYKSVWLLKQYIDQRACSGPSDEPDLFSAARLDYSFANCKNALDQKLLDDLYRKLLSESRASPPWATCRMHQGPAPGVRETICKARPVLDQV
ncbi:hypothetical protein BD310DRAFT_948564 [Dichomitus squalens]|uniref:MYND-type domain-containing protein n=1 Tax=Dichomitus squalens TaxID=114155 RepID=A0A4Q9PW04_9APHY|nr:hypothetical protein BD310DRAFT_948564 [Dichomitus squalens]